MMDAGYDIGIAIAKANSCGLTIEGKRAFCDDDRADPEIRRSECECRVAGKTALALIAKDPELVAYLREVAGEPGKHKVDEGSAG